MYWQKYTYSTNPLNMRLRKLKLLNLKLLNRRFFEILSFIIATSASPLMAQNLNGFGFPGLVELPTARHMPAGELVFQQKLDRSVHRSNAMFQLTPNIATAFRYVGQGRNSTMYAGRENWDRSFDVHIKLLAERQGRPELSFGMRDFIGTGWYTSEYVVVTKKFGPIDFTAGLGFGRLAGRNKIGNPLGALVPKLKARGGRDAGLGGELEFGQWFSGPASPFFGAKIQLSDKVAAAIEYNPDLMLQEANYLSVKSPINVGVTYRVNDGLELGGQLLQGNTYGLTASVILNPKRPPNGNGLELAPVPMRARQAASNVQTSPEIIKTVLKSEGFLLRGTQITGETIRVDIVNQEFRSVAQALGRITRTLQRFSSDNITKAKIVFIKHTVPVASYEINFNDAQEASKGREVKGIFKPKDVANVLPVEDPAHSNFVWALGPYLDTRFFDPYRPLRYDFGLNLFAGYSFSDNFSVSGSTQKSFGGIFDENIRESDSVLTHVRSDFPEYDSLGDEAIDHLTFKYLRKINPTTYVRAEVGYLETMFGGAAVEALYKPNASDLAFGIDLAVAKKREYDQMFGFKDYQTTTGHVSVYWDAGKKFDLQASVGRYLAGDWGGTLKVSRKFANGWKVGTYATLTDVPFDTFGEGSFDKGLFLEFPLDWMVGTKSRSQRTFVIKPITRDGGAKLMGTGHLHSLVSRDQNSEVVREMGRAWK